MKRMGLVWMNALLAAWQGRYLRLSRLLLAQVMLALALLGAVGAAWAKFTPNVIQPNQISRYTTGFRAHPGNPGTSGNTLYRYGGYLPNGVSIAGNGNPVTNCPMTFNYSGNHWWFSGNVNFPVGQECLFDFDVTSSTPGTYTAVQDCQDVQLQYNTCISGNPLSYTLIVQNSVAPPPPPSQATYLSGARVVGRSTAPADGQSQIMLEAFVKNSDTGQPVVTGVNFSPGPYTFVGGISRCITGYDGRCRVSVVSTVSGRTSSKMLPDVYVLYGQVPAIGGDGPWNGQTMNFEFTQGGITPPPPPGGSNVSGVRVVDSSSAAADGVAYVTLEGYVRDATTGLAVANAEVKFNGTPGVTFRGVDGSGLAQAGQAFQCYTNYDGKCRIVARSTVPGPKSTTVLMTYNNNQGFIPMYGPDGPWNASPLNYQFTKPVINGGVRVVTNDQAADGIAQNVLEVHVYSGNSVNDAYRSKWINFTWAGGSASCQTSYAGSCRASITSLVPGRIPVTVTLAEDNSPLLMAHSYGSDYYQSAPIDVNFVAPGSFDPRRSGVKVINDLALADGAAYDELEAFIGDGAGRPVSGVDVNFGLTLDVEFVGVASGNDAICRTNASGTCRVRATSLRDSVRFTTVVNVGGTLLSGTFNGYTPSPARYSFKRNTAPIGVVNSGVRIVGAKIVAGDGIATVVLEGFARDAVSGAAIANTIVQFAGTPGVSFASNGVRPGLGLGTSCITAADGRCRVEASSLVVGLKSTAVSIPANNSMGPIAAQGSDGPWDSGPLRYSFSSPLFDASKSGVQVLRDNAAADNVESNELKVFIGDSAGNGMANVDVSFARTADVRFGSAASPGVGTCRTNASGECSVLAYSRINATYTTEVSVNGVKLLGKDSVYTASPAKYTFSAVITPFLGDNAGVRIVGSSIASADGVATVVLEAYIVDRATGLPHANAMMQFAATPGVSFSSNGNRPSVGVGVTCTTGSDGRCRVEASSLVVGAKLTAASLVGGTGSLAIIDDPVSGVPWNAGPLSYEFAAPAFDASKSGVQVLRDQAQADGLAYDELEAFIADSAGQAMANMNVLFAGTPEVQFGSLPYG
ncbi:hypothetical protein, partial [Undibacterium sp. CCC3.4]